MPFRLAPLKKRVSPSAREPWKGVVACETSLPSLAKGLQGSDISAWVPSPKTGNEETLPQIQEIADRIASRYAGGLNKLSEVQRAWRQKQDALQRKRQNRLSQGGEEEPILSPSCRDDSSPGSFTAREASREGLQPSTSGVSQVSRGSSSTRKRRTRKKTWPRKADVPDAPEDVRDQVEEKETRIKDVLKSGLGDLFHQKREVYHEDPELHEVSGKRQSVLRRSESMRSQGGKGFEEEDARFGKGLPSAVSDADAASVMNSSANMEDPRMKRPRESAIPRRTMNGSLGPLGPFISKKNPRMVRQQEALHVEDDGERHGRQLSFATCSELAKKHRFTVPIVRHALEEFLSLDKNGDGRLSLNEFEQAIRDRCNIAPDEATPYHLLHLNWSKADKDNDSEINFEEFLLWSTEHLFTEELVVNDPQERYMRELARKFNLPLDQVEKCYKTFMSSDSNRNGFIEEGEFCSCVANLWNCDMEDIPATRFRQFWLEADKGRLGKLSFEVFLIWYMTIGVR